MSEFDLTFKIAPYLDRHLVFPLLQFLQERHIYDEKEILSAKLDLLSRTNMMDFAMDEFEKLSPGQPKPAHLVEKRGEVVKKLQTLNDSSKSMVEFFQNEAVIAHIQKSRDSVSLSQELQDNFQYKPQMLDVFYEFARFQFDCGNYSNASEFLEHYCILGTNSANLLSSLWGKFASEILTQNWDVAFDDMMKLKAYIDGSFSGNALSQLQQRSWLIHWSLFLFFNHPKGRDVMIDILLGEAQYTNTIQTTCPHILRYVTASVITSKRRRGVLKDLVRVIQQESYVYKDPITEFLECLYVNFDFDAAQTKLRQCEQVLEDDFFLVECRDDFIENARLFIFETYCRIHNTISISMLAEKLNMATDKAEEWIVNLIRNARLDAKIDSKEGHVVMTTQVTSIYHQVIEKTKSLSFRTSVLSDNIEKGKPVDGAAVASSSSTQQRQQRGPRNARS